MGIVENEALDVTYHVIMAKRIKLRYTASLRDISFFDAGFGVVVHNVT